METNWAAENLQVIRTLMERSAIYRRALAPIMLLLGTLGLAASLAGWLLEIESNQGFIGYWLLVSLAGVAGTYLLARRQAFRDGETFWSPPTRRVTQALLPPLLAGAVGSAALLIRGNVQPGVAWWMLPVWMTLYGCAIHAAGFFMPRGIKLLGWAFIVFGCLLAGFLAGRAAPPPPRFAHAVMCLLFGGLHMAYGVYLRFTEQRKNEA